MVANSVIDVIMGEAGGRTRAERYADMVAIASVVQNRTTLSGLTPQAIVAVPSEFNAYGKALPKGVEAYRSLAEQAWADVQAKGPVHNATFYATPKAKDNLPSGLKSVTTTAAHEYFADPQGRSFKTAQGFVTPAKGTVAAMLSGNLQAISNPYAAAVPPSAVIPSTMTAPPARPDVTATAAARGVPGTFSFNHPEQRGISTALANALTGASLDMGRSFSVISGHRTPEHNKSVGGARNSHHVTRNAVDISMKGMTAAERQSLVSNLAARGARGFITYSKTPDMLHVDMRNLDKPHFMHDRSAKNMGKAPGWFRGIAETKGILTPQTMDAPPSRPNPMAAPVGKVERGPALAPARSAHEQAIVDSHQQYAQSRMAAQPAPPSLPETMAAPLARPDVAPVSVAPAPAMPSAAPALGSIMAPPTAMTAPSLPSAVPARSVETTPVALSQLGSFPEAPKSPTASNLGSMAKGALKGAVTGGIPGAILGALAAPALSQIGRNIAHNKAHPDNKVSVLSGVRSQYNAVNPFGSIPSIGSVPNPFSGPAVPGTPGFGFQPTARTGWVDMDGNMLGSEKDRAQASVLGRMAPVGGQIAASMAAQGKAAQNNQTPGTMAGAPPGGGFFGSGGLFGGLFGGGGLVGGFPAAPAAPAGYVSGGGPSYGAMAGISPAAADAVAAGIGGLY